MELLKEAVITVNQEELIDYISLLHLTHENLIGEDYSVIKNAIKKEFNKNVSIEDLERLYETKYNYKDLELIIEEEEDFFDGY